MRIPEEFEMRFDVLPNDTIGVIFYSSDPQYKKEKVIAAIDNDPDVNPDIYIRTIEESEYVKPLFILSKKQFQSAVMDMQRFNKVFVDTNYDALRKLSNDDLAVVAKDNIASRRKALDELEKDVHSFQQTEMYRQKLLDFLDNT